MYSSRWKPGPGLLICLASLGCVLALGSLAPTLHAKETPADARPASQPGFIDEMIQKAWDDAGVRPSKPATDEEFLRRV